MSVDMPIGGAPSGSTQGLILSRIADCERIEYLLSYGVIWSCKVTIEIEAFGRLRPWSVGLGFLISSIKRVCIGDVVFVVPLLSILLESAPQYAFR